MPLWHAITSKIGRHAYASQAQQRIILRFARERGSSLLKLADLTQILLNAVFDMARF
uniref:Uncharacterized protein n=1 Tax=Curvibacter symbiont subsp. Hydra magnipapillata TaxID=667019 RepID=C9YFA7_CURXX|nr:hypothetical protein Csp_D32630 [Curvibacter putative symbiont of Hydra magnipapillata]